MKILILGGTGMLGHELWNYLRDKHEVWVTLRRSAEDVEQLRLFERNKIIGHLHAEDSATIRAVIGQLQPAVVLNCIGIIKQLQQAQDPIHCITINALLPHKLAAICGEFGARLIHFSTDCVFSGKRGNYVESDFSDADDLYGRTKFLGEINDLPHVFTIRSSIIGRELQSRNGLVEWFLAQKGTEVLGYKNAIFSGLTTKEMARVVGFILSEQPGLSGLWQIAGDPISKLNLLKIIKARFSLDVEIASSEIPMCDRSLNGKRFREKTGYRAPDWTTMIEEMAAHDQSENRVL